MNISGVMDDINNSLNFVILYIPLIAAKQYTKFPFCFWETPLLKKQFVFSDNELLLFVKNIFRLLFNNISKFSGNNPNLQWMSSLVSFLI